MTPGTIVLLNGTSGSGKTSIAYALQELMDEPFIHTGNDHFHAAFPQRFFVPSDGITTAGADGFLLVFAGEVQTFETPEGRRGFAGGTLTEVRIGPAGLRLHAGMYRAVAALASAGNNVVVDAAIHDPRVLGMAVAAAPARPRPPVRSSRTPSATSPYSSPAPASSSAKKTCRSGDFSPQRH